MKAREMLVQRFCLVAGGVAGATAVALAAALAHALPPSVTPHGVAAILSAIQMQGWHAIALMLTGLWLHLCRGRAARGMAELAGLAFAMGVPLFCGAVYLIELTGIHPGPMAPIGGILLMSGWLLLGGSALFAEPVS